MTDSIRDILAALGIDENHSGAFDGSWIETTGARLETVNPATEEVIGSVMMATPDEYERVVQSTVAAFEEWRTWTAPARGEIVRQLGEELRTHKEALGKLVSLEVGKVYSEGLGEVQEMIDMADLAVGMSRQLYGKTMHSERPQHRMYEQWLPLGPVGIITAFNFPVAVWAWNGMVAAVCGDSMLWKPSPEAPLCSIAVTRIAQKVLAANKAPAIFNLAIGTIEDVGEPMVVDGRFPLISATGSVPMGRRVGSLVAQRLGRSLLELGGNNGIVVMDDADLDLTLRGVVFAAAGTAAQRCTSLRRLFLHKGIAKDMTERLAQAFGSIRIG
ncbi:MAG: aldehyde dehydrogenase family protein, partial [Thermoanaerobaculia bacterium]|nr:aldehyde dehydrogenase family protein [Thermoanaerobaculia bacterium]